MTKHKPLIHAIGTGEANHAFHLNRFFRISPEDADCACFIFEEEIAEGASPPMHIHRTETEVFAVLSGSVKFRWRIPKPSHSPARPSLFRPVRGTGSRASGRACRGS